jgi:putative membrane protein
MWQRLGLVSGAILWLLIAQAVAQQTPPPSPPQWYGPWWADSYGWPFWWMCPVMMLVMLAVVAGIILARRRSGDGHRASLQILAERFARGEIQKEEYQEKKAAILEGG